MTAGQEEPVADLVARKKGLVLCSTSGTILDFDDATGRCSKFATGHSAPCTSLALDENGFLYTASLDGKICE